MISKAIIKNLHTLLTASPAEQSPTQPYLVLPALAISRPQPRRRAVSAPRHPVMHPRAHRGLRLVSTPRVERPARSAGKPLWSGWLDQNHLDQKDLHQKHLDQRYLDRGFLLLAVSSALLLLLSSR